jgi:phage baseplate assembly protein W
MATEFEDIYIDNVSEDVEDLDYISQILKVVLGTPRGSLPCMPNFGCGLQYDVDAPINGATIANIQNSVYEGISDLVPDTTITAIRVEGEVTGKIEVTPIVRYQGDLVP